MSFPYFPSRPAEQTIYECLWRIADTNGVGEIGGQAAVNILKMSGLDNTALRNIWSLSTDTGVMNEKQFYLALRYITLVQNGESLSAGINYPTSGSSGSGFVIPNSTCTCLVP